MCDLFTKVHFKMASLLLKTNVKSDSNLFNFHFIPFFWLYNIFHLKYLSQSSVFFLFFAPFSFYLSSFRSSLLSGRLNLILFSLFFHSVPMFGLRLLFLCSVLFSSWNSFSFYSLFLIISKKKSIFLFKKQTCFSVLILICQLLPFQWSCCVTVFMEGKSMIHIIF